MATPSIKSLLTVINMQSSLLKHGAINGFELLLKRNVEAVSTTTTWDATLHTTNFTGHEAVVQLLLDHGAEVKAVNNSGWIPHMMQLKTDTKRRSSCCWTEERMPRHQITMAGRQ
jgi:hypothetical protein